VVIKKNNLKATAEEVYDAVTLLNDVGAKQGANGLPELLPGLNFVFGLEGETKNTFDLDYEFLKKIYDDTLLLRRINLRQVYGETYEGKLTFARQLGSYPLLIGIPGVYPLHQFYDVKIVEYGYRSLTAVPFPLDVNTVPRETLEALPGVGKKRAIRILAKRPFHTKKEFINAFDDPSIAHAIEEYVQLN